MFTRRIVGWVVSGNLHTAGLPLLAFEHVLVVTGASRGCQGLVHHSDRDAQHVSLAHLDALITAGVSASVTAVGLSYDNALAETVNGLYKAEFIHSQRRWESTQAVELATVDWSHWWNSARMHQALGLLHSRGSRDSLQSPPRRSARSELTPERNPRRFTGDT